MIVQARSCKRLRQALFLNFVLVTALRAHPLPLQLLARATEDDSDSAKDDSSTSKKQDDQSWSKYTKYKILGVPLYIWLLFVTAAL